MRQKLSLVSLALIGMLWFSACATRTIYTRANLAPTTQQDVINYFLPKKVVKVSVTYTYLDLYLYESIRGGSRDNTQRLLKVIPIGYYVERPIRVEFQLKPDYSKPYHLDYSELGKMGNTTFQVDMDREDGTTIRSVNARFEPLRAEIFEASANIFTEGLALIGNFARNAAAANDPGPNKDLIYEYEQREVTLTTIIEANDVNKTYTIPTPPPVKDSKFSRPRLSLTLGENTLATSSSFNNVSPESAPGIIYRLSVPTKTEIAIEDNVQEDRGKQVIFSELITYPQFGHYQIAPLLIRGQKNITLAFNQTSGALSSYQVVKTGVLEKNLNAGGNALDQLGRTVGSLENNRLDAEVDRLKLENERLEERLRRIELQRALDEDGN